MVGVCSDEIVSLHKSDTAMNHEERSVALIFHFRCFDSNDCFAVVNLSDIAVGRMRLLRKRRG